MTKSWAPGWWKYQEVLYRQEESKEAVIREVREETGLDVSDCEGGLSFTYQRENLEEGDNYFVDVYHFIKNFSEEDVVLQKRKTADFQIATLEGMQGNCKRRKVFAL